MREKAMKKIGYARKNLILLLFAALLMPQTVRAQDEVWDPIEPVNRGIFWFNDQFDIYLLEPVARGYDAVVPNTVQRKVDNFFTNLKYPVFLVSDIVQFKFGQAATHTGRFLINSTIGVAGLFDVASEWGLEHQYTDFGVALGYRGVPEGFYLVIPFLGPSNTRDAVGRIVDGFLNPTYYIGYTDLSEAEEWWIIIGTTVLDAVNTRASLLDAVESAKEASLDYYLFVQSAYHQRRQNLITGESAPEDEPPPPGDESGRLTE